MHVFMGMGGRLLAAGGRCCIGRWLPLAFVRTQSYRQAVNESAVVVTL